MAQPTALSTSPVIYPDSDGMPMADNTLQFQWIVTIKENLEATYRDDGAVFVAGDLLWYPEEGNNKLCQAPDVLVAFGRPKGYRGSYLQWEEGGIAPQVVFEILSPGNRHGQLVRKFRFYERYGVEEYYVYDPDHQRLEGWQRIGAELQEITPMHGWVSPRLRIRFEIDDHGLRIFRPDGQPFLTFVELEQERVKALERAAQAEQRADKLAAQLRKLGVEPENGQR